MLYTWLPPSPLPCERAQSDLVVAGIVLTLLGFNVGKYQGLGLAKGPDYKPLGYERIFQRMSGKGT
jgi:hypothetical protein